MATRRTHKAQFEIPIPNGKPNSTHQSPNSASTTFSTTEATTATTPAYGAVNLDAPPPLNSPFLPTPLELLLLSIYPTTLLLGSLFSTLHPSTRHATYLSDTQAYHPSSAPSYFAKKGNVFNIYFVKIGWFWITSAFFLLLASHSHFGPALKPTLTSRRIQAVLRYTAITAVWILVTQWCFGPPIIDRSFRWTGGQCARVDERANVLSDPSAGDVLTHAACRAIGGQWSGGHDISGHVFLLILGSAMLWLELLPTVLSSAAGLTSARRILTFNGVVRSASSLEESTRDAAPQTANRRAGAGQDTPIPLQAQRVGVQATLLVAGLSWWMLLMTAAYFHTWFEKFTGLLVAFVAIYAVYFLPRGVAPMRRVLGLPGV